MGTIHPMEWAEPSVHSTLFTIVLIMYSKSGPKLKVFITIEANVLDIYKMPGI
jgi:hypothetical protein